MAKCPNCGREVAEEANSCGACGASMRPSAIDAMIEDARSALASDPDDASARYNLAIAYKLGGANELALEELRRVAELQPEFADVHYEIGLLEANSGRREEAIAALARALETDPSHSGARALLARLTGEGRV